MITARRLDTARRRVFLISDLRLYQTPVAVFFTQGGFFDFTRGISRHGGEDDFPRPLIPGQLPAERLNLRLRTGRALLDLDNSGGNLPQPLVRQADDRRVLNLLIPPQKVLNLYRIQILSAGCCTNKVDTFISQERSTIEGKGR